MTRAPFQWSRHPEAVEYLQAAYGMKTARAIAAHLNEVYGAEMSANTVRNAAFTMGIGGGDNQGMPNVIEAAAEIGCDYQGLWRLIKVRGWAMHGRGHWRFLPPKTMALAKLFYSNPAGRRRKGLPQTLTIAEAAALWGTSTQRVEAAIAEGRVQAERVFGELRLTVEAWRLATVGGKLPRRPAPEPRPIRQAAPKRVVLNAGGKKPAANHPWRQRFMA